MTSLRSHSWAEAQLDSNGRKDVCSWGPDTAPRLPTPAGPGTEKHAPRMGRLVLL